jgi:arginine/ornithine N-succinyltransferase beta subunit
VGAIYFGPARRKIPIDDRVLAHVRVVVMAKFRRNEACSFTWRRGETEKHGRSSVWLHPSIPIEFEFDGTRSPTLNREWITLLEIAANSASGLTLVPEPEGPQNPLSN